MVHKNNLSKNDIKKHTLYWVKSTVIHYNLCPFANKVYTTGRLQVDVSGAQTDIELLEDSLVAIQKLLSVDREEIETLLLVHPECLIDFSDYNDFLYVLDRCLEEMALTGIIQIASFHPDYCFAQTHDRDAANYTNRSPYPMLHFLREASVTDAIEDWQQRGLNTDDIPSRNIETLRKIGEKVLAEQRLDCFR